MRNGTIELASGRWYWTVLPQWTGSTVVFQHRDRMHDEMRNWTQLLELTPAEAAELARDPLERVWMDVDGLKWRVSLELPSDWRREPMAPEEGRTSGLMSLVFRRGGVRRLVEVPASVRLGEYTHGELRERLESAYRAASGARE